MKRLISRSRVFFEHRTVRIGISLAVLVSCSVGLLTVYYIRNSTYNYADELRSNEGISKSNDGFMDEKGYQKFRSSDVIARDDEEYLVLTHRMAVGTGLVKPSDSNQSNIRLFLDEVTHAKKDASSVVMTEREYDQSANEMQQVVRELVDYANSLNISHQFEEKKRALLVASQICASLDCRYSYSAYMARVYSSESVLNELCSLQKSDAAADLKKALIESCLLELKRPLRTERMLKKEELRLLQSYDITLGRQDIENDSITYKMPEDFPMWAKLVQRLPKVEKALRSRVYEAFNAPLSNIRNIKKSTSPDFQTGVDPGSLGMFADRVRKNRASIDLIEHFAPELLDFKNTGILHRMQADIRFLSKPTIQ